MNRNRLYYCAVVLLTMIFSMTEGTAFAKPASEVKPIEKTVVAEQVTLQIDKTEVGQEDTVKITGTAPMGKPVFIEVASEKTVEVRRLDSKKDKETGKIPWIFYTSDDIPAYYITLTPKDTKDKIEALKAQKEDWSYSGALKDMGIDPVGPAARFGKSRTPQDLDHRDDHRFAWRVHGAHGRQGEPQGRSSAL